MKIMQAICYIIGLLLIVSLVNCKTDDKKVEDNDDKLTNTANKHGEPEKHNSDTKTHSHPAPKTKESLLYSYLEEIDKILDKTGDVLAEKTRKVKKTSNQPDDKVNDNQDDVTTEKINRVENDMFIIDSIDYLENEGGEEVRKTKKKITLKVKDLKDLNKENIDEDVTVLININSVNSDKSTIKLETKTGETETLHSENKEKDEEMKIAESENDNSEPEEATEDEKESIRFYDLAMKLYEEQGEHSPTARHYLLKSADLGHWDAQNRIMALEIFRDTYNNNYRKLLQLIMRYAETGNPTAQFYVGVMYANGISVQANQAKALVYYTIAASQGNIFAQMALGYRNFAAISVASNCEKALSYYRNVAKDVERKVSLSGGATVQRTRLLDEDENLGTFATIFDQNLVQYYQLMADKGDVSAQIGLGQLYYQGGRGVQQDHQRALQYFHLAADSGHASAMAFIGKMYLEGSAMIKQSNETAHHYFKMAAEKGNPVGQAGLGLLYLQGRGVDKDYKKAFSLFTQAASQGWVDGQLQLGIMYLNGFGVQRDFKAAIKYFTLASQSGHVLGLYHLGEIHANGTGALRSCSNAVELFKNVAERGHWSAKLMDAHAMYRSGKVQEAYLIYSIYSELGYEVAQSNAAYILDNGKLGIFDSNGSYRRAFMYWQRSATQGYSLARVKLGDYYYYGYGVPVDYEASAAQYHLASEQQNNARALFNLGYMHECGLGLKRDYHLAKRYYDLAADSSVDAHIPVALARLKLEFVFGFEDLSGFQWFKLFDFDEELIQLLAGKWDIYLLTMLAIWLATLLYARRAPQQ